MAITRSQYPTPTRRKAAEKLKKRTSANPKNDLKLTSFYKINKTSHVKSAQKAVDGKQMDSTIGDVIRSPSAWSGRLKNGGSPSTAAIVSSPTMSSRYSLRSHSQASESPTLSTSALFPKDSAALPKELKMLLADSLSSDSLLPKSGPKRKLPDSRSSNHVARQLKPRVISDARRASLAKARQVRLERLAARKQAKEAVKQRQIEFEKAVKEREQAMTSRIVYSRGHEGEAEFVGDENEVKEVRHLMERFFYYYQHSNYPCPYDIVQVERLVNPFLEERYKVKKEEFKSLYGECEESEMLMFHGTPSPNVRSICRDGFKIGGVDGHRMTHGSSMGYGVYTGKWGSASYSYCSVTSDGRYRMFAVRCLLGKTTRDGYQLNKPGDSILVNDILVLCSVEQCLPAYLVTYRTRPAIPQS